MMKTELGLWIDHRTAVIVTIVDGKEEINRINSDIEQSEQIPASTPQSRPEDRNDRHFGKQLGQYYAEVIAAIKHADSILILGPGEAKGELQKLLVHEKLGDRIVGIETVDKMTEPQIVANIRSSFLKSPRQRVHN